VREGWWRLGDYAWARKTRPRTTRARDAKEAMAGLPERKIYRLEFASISGSVEVQTQQF